MTTWILPAHATEDVPATAEEVALAARMPELVRIVRAGSRSVGLATTGVVGTRVEGSLRITVQPRHLSREVVLGLILGGGASKLYTHPDEEEDDPDLLRILGSALCRSLRTLFQRGLRRVYEGRRVQGDVLRGELDLDRWYGPSSPEGPQPWCRVRDRSVDLPEHRVLVGALRVLSRSTAADAPLRSRAAALAGRMEGVSTVLPPRTSWVRLRTTGLFASYAEPLALARILLDGLLGEDGEGDRGRGFLVNLDRLFERWLAVALGELVPSTWSVTAQETTRLAPGLTRYLDVAVWDQRGRLRAVLDAKNKSFGPGTPPRNDVHQLVSYMATQSCAEGALVGIRARGAPAGDVFELRGRVGRMHVARLRGEGTLADLAKDLAGWALALGFGG